MSAQTTSTRTLVVALLANLGIAFSKFVAAAITGSSAMLTEGVHSVVDCTNQLLLMWGRHASKRAPDKLHTLIDIEVMLPKILARQQLHRVTHGPYPS